MTNTLDAAALRTFPPAIVRTDEISGSELDPRFEQHADVSPVAEFFPGYRVVAIVPCFNEEAAITKVVRDLQAHVGDIEVYVYDNCSTDRTADVARAAGAIVRTETLKGKGNVVRRAFADIEADVYLLIDGDDTYDAAAAPRMIRALLDGPYDHVLGIREPEETALDAYRGGHEFGNRLLNRIVGGIFGSNTGDMLSGYRVFSRRFVKSFPAVSREFEIETELTVHCLALRVPATSLQIGFRDRAEGTESKLRTYRDGYRILRLIMNLTRHERPIAFYGVVATFFALIGGALMAPSVAHWASGGEFVRNGGLSLGLTAFIVAFLCLVVGVILDGTRKTRHELSRLAYLSHRAVDAGRISTRTVHHIDAAAIAHASGG